MPCGKWAVVALVGVGASAAVAEPAIVCGPVGGPVVRGGVPRRACSQIRVVVIGLVAAVVPDWVAVVAAAAAAAGVVVRARGCVVTRVPAAPVASSIDRADLVGEVRHTYPAQSRVLRG